MARRTNTATVEQPEENALAPVVVTPVKEHTKQDPRKPPVDAAVRAIIAERLQSDPLISHRQLADEVGVSHDFVSVVARKLAEGETDVSEKRMKSLVRQIGKRLSTSDRAMVYESVIRGQANAKAAFSQLSALKRIEELEGIVTRKEQREVADNSVPVLPPMFVLKDADVDIGVAIQVRQRKRGSAK